MAERAQAREDEAPRYVTNPIRIQKFLGGLNYPADKGSILARARERGADGNVMHTLDAIPDGKYASPVAISREIGKLK